MASVFGKVEEENLYKLCAEMCDNVYSVGHVLQIVVAHSINIEQTQRQKKKWHDNILGSKNSPYLVQKSSRSDSFIFISLCLFYL